MAWKTIHCENIYYKKDGTISNISGQSSKHIRTSNNNFKNQFEDNFKENLKTMDKLCEKISKEIGEPCYYRVYSHGNESANFVIKIQDFFPKQEDWEILTDLVPENILDINFINTSNEHDYHCYTDKKGKILINGETYTAIPSIKYNEIGPYPEMEDVGIQFSDSLISREIIKENISKYGSFVANEYNIKPLYLFKFDDYVLDADKIVVEDKHWEQKCIKIVADNFKYCKEAIKIVKPFAEEYSRQIECNMKAFKNIKEKLKIIAE